LCANINACVNERKGAMEKKERARIDLSFSG